MATISWISRQQRTNQVDEAQLTAFDASTTYTATVNGKDVSVAGDTDAATTISALVTAWNNSTEPEIAEITAAVKSGATDTIEWTADTAAVQGKPVTISTSVSGGTGTFASVSTTTSPKNPSDYNDAENWSGGAVPVNSDVVVISDGGTNQSILNGFSQSGVTLAQLNIKASFEGFIGRPIVNAGAGGSSYREYLATYLATGATAVRIGEGEGAGSGRIKLNLGSVQSTVDVFQTGSSPEDNLEAVLLLGTHASNVVNVNRGSVGIAVYEGETATVATLRVGSIAGGSADVRCGPGVTLTTIEARGGTLDISSNATTLTVSGGAEVTVRRAAAITTVNVDGGRVNWLSSGTITTLNLYRGGSIDFSQDLRSRTVTNKVNAYSGSSFNDPHGTVTLSGGWQTVGCRLSDVAFSLGLDRDYTVS